jgi:hypothetical protein
MERTAVNQISLERFPLGQFLHMGLEDLRDLSADFANIRVEQRSLLDVVALRSLIRVMERQGYTAISQLGRDAATVWATHIGVG